MVCLRLTSHFPGAEVKLPYAAEVAFDLSALNPQALRFASVVGFVTVLVLIPEDLLRHR